MQKPGADATRRPSARSIIQGGPVMADARELKIQVTARFRSFLSRAYNSSLMPGILRLAPRSNSCRDLNAQLTVGLPLALRGKQLWHPIGARAFGGTRYLRPCGPFHSLRPNLLRRANKAERDPTV